MTTVTNVPPVLHDLPAPQRVTVGGRPICYRQAGEGPPLILIHGWGASSRYWYASLQMLADQRTVYAIDLPGFGESPANHTANAEDLAALIVEFADALGLDQFALNGHSFGGAVAAYIAGHWPQRVERLVLTCFSVPGGEFERALFAQWHTQLDFTLMLFQPWLMVWQPWYTLVQPWLLWQMSMPPLPQLVAGRFFHQTPSDTRMLQEGMADLLRMPPQVALQSAASVGDPLLIEALRLVKAPTLVLGGRQDMIMPPYGVMEVAAMLPQSYLAWIDECGHVPMVERPELYNQMLRVFLGANL